MNEDPRNDTASCSQAPFKRVSETSIVEIANLEDAAISGINSSASHRHLNQHVFGQVAISLLERSDIVAQDNVLESIALCLRQIDSAESAAAIGTRLYMTLLEGLARKLPDPEQVNFFTKPEIDSNQRLTLLRYVSSEQRIWFLKALTKLSATNSRTAEILQGKLGNILTYATNIERAELAKWMLEEKPLQYSEWMATKVILSGGALSDITEIATMVGLERIGCSHNRALADIATRASFGDRLRKLALPLIADPDPHPREIDRALSQLEESLENAAQSLNSEAAYEKSSLHARFFEIAMRNLEELRERRSNASSLAALKEAINYISVRSQVEFFYGVILSDERPSYDTPGATWDLPSVLAAQSALSRIPEGVLFCTQGLQEVRRVHSVGEGILGQRLGNGLILLTDLAVENGSIEMDYRGFASLEVVLTHELGHSVHLGDCAGAFRLSGNKLEFVEGDPEYEFGEFRKLSGWEVISPERITRTDNLHTVLIDGEEVRVGVVSVFKRELVTLFQYQGFVYMHRALAGFPASTYSRVNPWEDWAETFTDYFITPERLVRLAPRKFLYFEREFGVYRDRLDLFRALRASIDMYEQAGRDLKYA